MPTTLASPAEPREPSRLARLAVAALACILTVSILGSAAFLWQNRAQAQDRDRRIQSFVSRLAVLRADEIAERAEALRETPQDARRVITAVLKRLRRERSPRIRLASVRLIQAFTQDDPRIAERLFELRGSPDET